MNAILKFILLKILNHLFGKSKRFKAIMDYVHKPNELDHIVEEHATRIKSQSDRLIAIEKLLKKIKKLK